MPGKWSFLIGDIRHLASLPQSGGYMITFHVKRHTVEIYAPSSAMTLAGLFYKMLVELGERDVKNVNICPINKA